VRRALFIGLRRRASGDIDERVVASWNLLGRLQKSAPAAVSEVLAHPYVRAWAERCLRSGDSMSADVAYLASIAAAMAIRFGAGAEVEIPAIEGHVYLPTLGRLRVGDVRTVVLTVVGRGRFEARADTGRWRVETEAELWPPDWQPLRQLRVRQLAVRLEDTDPYRGCYPWPAAPRLTESEAAVWQTRFQEAWSLIEEVYPRYAPAVAAGLGLLMPLANDVP
jgi:uncharacterized protein